MPKNKTRSGRAVQGAESHPTYEPMAARDLPDVARLITLAFAATPKSSTKWVKENGPENIRVLRAGKEIPACLRRIEMGQFFGGRSVPLCGIAGVATAPEARGQGHARRMMEACVREMHERGEALGGLYCSTQALYRQSGFEQAGHRFRIRVPVARLVGAHKERRVIPLVLADQKRIERCYAEYARPVNGMLDRRAYIWKRIRDRKDTNYQGFGVPKAGGQLEGYVFLSQEQDPKTLRQEIELSDIAFTSAEAGRRLIAFLADYEPMADWLQFWGGPLHPFLTLLPQQRYEVKMKDYWMLRVVDVKKAFEARGYSSAVQGSTDIDVTDELIGANSGRWRMMFEGGRARVTRTSGGGRGGVRCGIRGLAAMYSGLYSPRQAAILGMCSGDERSLDVLGGALAGTAPWMTDGY